MEGESTDPLAIPAFLRRTKPQQESIMHDQPITDPTNTHGVSDKLTVTAKVDATDAIAAVRAEMANLNGEPPADDMTIEEAQKRLSEMVKQRDALDVGIKAYKKYVTKKIAAL